MDLSKGVGLQSGGSAAVTPSTPVVMTRFPNGVILFSKIRPASLPAIIIILAVSFLLTACGTSVANNNWPGMTSNGENLVFVAFGRGLVAVDVAEQEQLWFFRPQDANASLQFYAPPEIDEDQLVFGDYGASGGFLSPRVKVSVYAIEDIMSANPTEIWNQGAVAQDRIIAQALQVRDTVFLGTADNKVLALDATDGTAVWDGPFEAEHSIWGQATYEDGTLYVPSLDKFVYALDSETGDEIWRSNVGGSVNDKPILVEDLLYVGSFDKQVHALDKQSGEARWTAPAMAAVWGAPAYADDTVFFADLNGNVFAVDASTGDQIWRNGVDQFTTAATVVEDGVVYVAGAGDPDERPDDRRGTLTAFSAETGEQLWQESTPTPLFTTPVIASDSIVVAMQSEQSPLTLVAYDLTDGTTIWDDFEPNIPSEG